MASHAVVRQTSSVIKVEEPDPRFQALVRDSNLLELCQSLRHGSQHRDNVLFCEGLREMFTTVQVLSESRAISRAK